MWKILSNRKVQPELKKNTTTLNFKRVIKAYNSYFYVNSSCFACFAMPSC